MPGLFGLESVFYPEVTTDRRLGFYIVVVGTLIRRQALTSEYAWQFESSIMALNAFGLSLGPRYSVPSLQLMDTTSIKLQLIN